MTHAVALSHTWKRLKPHAADLVAQVAFPLCCFDDEDAELWVEDPQEYIRKACPIPVNRQICQHTDLRLGYLSVIMHSQEYLRERNSCPHTA